MSVMVLRFFRRLLHLFSLFWSLFEINRPEIDRLRLLSQTRWLEKENAREIYENIYACYSYEDPDVKNTILELKNYKDTALARNISRVAGLGFLPILSELVEMEGFSLPTLTCVPVEKKKLREIGFNHAEVCAIEFALALNLPFDNNVIRKIRETKRQHDLSRKDRLWNLTNAFEVVDKGKISGQNFIIFDDVTTTGSTFVEIQKTLQKAGARKVICVALAH